LTNERYAPLFQLEPTDYVGWAHGLKQCGYATDPRYAQKLINLIERLNLQVLDQKVLAEAEPVLPNTVQQVGAHTPTNAVHVTASSSTEKTPAPPPSTPIPDSYVPSGKGERPVVRVH